MGKTRGEPSPFGGVLLPDPAWWRSDSTAGGAEVDRGGSRDAERCAAPGQPLGGDAALRPPRGGGTPAPGPGGVPRSAGARGVVRAAAARMELCPRGQDRRSARGGVFGAASGAREPDRDLPAGLVRGGADHLGGREGRSPPLPFCRRRGGRSSSNGRFSPRGSRPSSASGGSPRTARPRSCAGSRRARSGCGSSSPTGRAFRTG